MRMLQEVVHKILIDMVGWLFLLKEPMQTLNISYVIRAFSRP